MKGEKKIMSDSVVKITKKERFESIIALCETIGEMDGFDTAGIKEFCENEIETLAKRAASAKERAAKKAKEADALMEAVFAVLGDEPMTREQVFDLIDADAFEELSVAKVGYRLTALVKDGRAVKESVNIVGEDGKNKARAAYRLA